PRVVEIPDSRRGRAARRSPPSALVPGAAASRSALRDYAAGRPAHRAPSRAKRHAAAGAGRRPAADRLHRLDPGGTSGPHLGATVEKSRSSPAPKSEPVADVPLSSFSLRLAPEHSLWEGESRRDKPDETGKPGQRNQEQKFREDQREPAQLAKRRKKKTQ